MKYLVEILKNILKGYVTFNVIGHLRREFFQIVPNIIFLLYSTVKCEKEFTAKTYILELFFHIYSNIIG